MTLPNTQREHLLATLEARREAEGASLTPERLAELEQAWLARRAEEEAQEGSDYLALLPEAPEPPRWTLRDWFLANFNRPTLYEYLTGSPAIDCTCRDCIDRAAGRHLRFSLAVVGIVLIALSIGLPALASTPY
jgi:hypothetical protein